LKNLIKIKLLTDKKILEETLCRMGVANKKDKIIYPSCYLYEIENEFYIIHFKQLFLITRNDSYNNVSDDDLQRRNSIIFCLKNWGLVDADDEEIEPHNKFIFILPFKDKNDWIIRHKFNFSFGDK